MPKEPVQIADRFNSAHGVLADLGIEFLLAGVHKLHHIEPVRVEVLIKIRLFADLGLVENVLNQLPQDLHFHRFPSP